MIARGLRSLGLCPLGDYYTAEEIVKMSVDAEKSGFSEIWVPEHFCSGDAISILGALSKMTSKVQLATGIVGIATRHPVLTAMTAANLQTLSKGRMTLGLGLTVLNWLERLGYDYSKPLTLIKESFTIIKGMLEGETVDFEGRYFKARGMKLAHKPEKKIPIFIAAVGPSMLEFAATRADGVLLTAVSSASYAERAKRKVLESIRASKRASPPLVYSLVLSSVGQKRNTALLNGLLDMLSRPGRPQQVLAEGSYNEGRMLLMAEALKSGRRNEAMSYLTDDIIDQVAVRGSLSKCEEALINFKKAGVDLPVLMPVPGTYKETALLAQRISGVE
jgi:5,10-methylenetetrahydromethanopterin reductase